MYDFIASLLAWLYDLWPSYGGAILLLTVIIMVVLAPFTIRQTRSMLAMQDLQPEVKRLRQKYGSDRERMNQEMMALYQANGVNPLGGCLPILIQAPIFLVLFQVVQGLTRREASVGLATGDAVLRAPGVGVSEFGDRVFNPAYLDTATSLYQDLAVSTEMRSFGLDLSQSASDALGESIIGGIPYLLLVISVGVTTWLQQKQIQGRSSAAAMNPQQQMLMKVLPFMLPVFSFGFPAALVVYWFVSNLFRVGQQVFITKRVYGTREAEAQIIRPDEKKSSSAAKDGSGTKTTEKSTKTDDRDTTPRKGSGGTDHGRRSPVSGPPPKKRKKPPAAKGSANGSSAPSRDREPRPTSKRVTPKKNTPAPEPEPKSSSGSSWRRRDRKKT
jgi:YidC/Oxa1 family membrane protein insertase